MKKLLFTFIIIALSISHSYQLEKKSKVMNILVYPFNNTGDKRYSWLSSGMTDTVISDLCKIKSVNVFSEDDRKKVIREIELSMTGLISDEKKMNLGRIMGADVILTGAYTVVGQQVRIVTKLITVETSKVEKSAKFDGSIDDLYSLQDKLVVGLLEEAKTIAPDRLKTVDIKQAKNTISNKYKPLKAAFEYYSKGLQVVDANPKEALENFKKAIDVDSNYADAYREAGITAGYRMGLINESTNYFDVAQKLYTNEGNSETVEYQRLLNSMGVVYTNHSNKLFNSGLYLQSHPYSVKALEYLTKSKEVLEKLGMDYTRDYCQAMNNLGFYYLGKGPQKNAGDYLMKSKSLYETLGLDRSYDYTITLQGLAIFYRNTDPIYGRGRIIEYFQRAKSIFDELKLNDSINYASLLYALGSALDNNNEKDAGYDMHRKAMVIFEKQKKTDTITYALVMHSLASKEESYVREGKGSKRLAAEYYRKASHAYKNNGKNTDAEIMLKNAEKVSKYVPLR